MKRTLGPLVLALALLQGTVGCTFSEDRTIYKSTYEQPQSVYAVYRPSNETVWSYDIPPQHLLVVEFDTGDGTVLEAFRQSDNYPTKLSWELHSFHANKSLLRNEHYTSTPVESGEIALNGSPIIIGATVGQPIDPATLPTDRPIEEIEQDLPEPDTQ